LLNLINRKINPESGSVEIGETVKIAYFSQESEHTDPNLRAIEYIKETSEYVTTADGAKITASQMMENFLILADQQYSKISNLSGGELRRLYLLKILMNAPNVLILDEPTNDLDIDTLSVLESYIDGFSGPVIAVSHDRYFLDRVCNKIMSFDGNGIINLHTGNYFDYLDDIKEAQSIEPSILLSTDDDIDIDTKGQRTGREKKKLSYKEQREYESLESEIGKLESELEKIDLLIKENETNFVKLQELSDMKDLIEDKLIYKLEREEYFKNLIESFK